MNNQHTSELDHKYRTMAIIWLILLMSQLVFIGVAFSVKGSMVAGADAAEQTATDPIIIVAFALLAVVNFILSFVMRRRAAQQAIAEKNVMHVQTGLVIGCALCESISIIGVVLAIAFSFPYFYLWIGLGMFGIFLHFPRRKELYDANAGKLTSN